MKSNCSTHILIKYSETHIVYHTSYLHINLKRFEDTISAWGHLKNSFMINTYLCKMKFFEKYYLNIYCILLWKGFLYHLGKLWLVNVSWGKISLEMIPESHNFKLCKLCHLNTGNMVRSERSLEDFDNLDKLVIFFTREIFIGISLIFLAGYNDWHSFFGTHDRTVLFWKEFANF